MGASNVKENLYSAIESEDPQLVKQILEVNTIIIILMNIRQIQLL